MKKLRFLGIFAITFALVFAATSCQQDTTPSGDSVKEVIDNGESLAGTWKITEGSYYQYYKMTGLGNDAEDTEESDDVEEVAALSNFFSVTNDFTDAQLLAIAESVEAMKDESAYTEEVKAMYGSDANVDFDIDARFVVNENRDKITYYVNNSGSVSASYSGVTASIDSEYEITVVLEKQ